ncbi:unnamed protein product [Effrenium voratum]|uniref:Uncharacterized protein n=1 Tax=Effrenium voratum TaxID=2562239 RepID=A0AA36MKU4_9DINO|nr:unnamed protein product [Effrenium voratum]|mmetsp:Transcript_112240/g.267598  ORF Transcript_112240/g.267598 Transcript_112240/m.267598 type:complete len:113 (-) Transcript_112240:70-408(-)
MEKKEKNVCHQMEIWKQLIDTELKTAASWECQWGFLKGEQKMQGSASAPMLKDLRAGKMDRTQALTWRTKTPQQRYGRPLATSHEIGWRPSIERFGVSHHGIKRDPGIWPDI